MRPNKWSRKKLKQLSLIGQFGEDLENKALPLGDIVPNTLQIGRIQVMQFQQNNNIKTKATLIRQIWLVLYSTEPWSKQNFPHNIFPHMYNVPPSQG